MKGTLVGAAILLFGVGLGYTLKRSPEPYEDFSNNIEYLLFDPETLKLRSPEIYNWLRGKYGDSFKLVRKATRK